MRRTSAIVVALLVTVAVVVPAAAKPSKHRGLNACALLKRSEVSALIHEPVAKVSGSRTATGAAQCSWIGKDSHLFSKGLILIAAHDQAKARFGKYRSLLGKTTKVKGLGDAAATNGTTIIARAGNGRFLDIGPLSRDTVSSYKALIPLARTALSRIR